MGVILPFTNFGDPTSAVNFVIDSQSKEIGGSIGTQNVTSTTDCLVVNFDQAQLDGNQTKTDNSTVFPGETLHFGNEDVVVQSVLMSKGALAVQLPDRNTILQNLGSSVSHLSGTGRTIGTSDAEVVNSIWFKVMYDTSSKDKSTTNIDIKDDEWQDLLGKLVNTLGTAQNGDCIAMSASRAWQYT